MNIDKVNIALNRLRAFEPKEEPYYVCYSGGKDSDCIRILCDLSGVSYELHHNHTSMDAPETVNYIKTIPDVIFDYSYYPDGKRKTIWNLIPKKKFPPTRLMRWCCSELKEYGGEGRLKVTGVRWAESVKRSDSAAVIKITSKIKSTIKFLKENGLDYSLSKQGGIKMHFDNEILRDEIDLIHHCYIDRSVTVNPIVDWSDSDVWEFLNYYGCQSNPLYYSGCHRIGCVGCPLSGCKQMQKDFYVYPAYKNNYIRAFDKMLLERSLAGLPNRFNWSCGDDVFNWWTDENYNPDQLEFILEDVI